MHAVDFLRIGELMLGELIPSSKYVTDVSIYLQLSCNDFVTYFVF